MRDSLSIVELLLEASGGPEAVLAVYAVMAEGGLCPLEGSLPAGGGGGAGDMVREGRGEVPVVVILLSVEQQGAV